MIDGGVGGGLRNPPLYRTLHLVAKVLLGYINITGVSTGK